MKKTLGSKLLGAVLAGAIAIASISSFAINSFALLPGDINGDGKVTAADAILCLRAEAKLITLTPEQALSADATGDGVISAADAIRILRFEAKLIDELNPVNEKALAYYNTALNKAKNEAKSVQVENLNEVKDVKGVEGSFGNVLQMLMDKFLKPGAWSIEASQLPPAGEEAAVKMEWLSDIQMTETEDKITIKLFLKEEGNNPQPGKSNHGKTIDTLKDEDVKKAINGTKLIKLNKFETTYKNCTSEIVVEKSTGRILSIQQFRSIFANAETNVVKNVSATINSNYNYTLVW